MKRLIQLVGILAVAGLVMACGGDSPQEPTATLSPSPSPTPTPSDSDPKSCKQTNLTMVLLNGAGNPDALFDFREYVTAVARPLNRSGAQLAPECDFIRTVGWSIHGPVCTQYGDKTGFSTLFKCDEAGDLTIIATHGEHKAIFTARLIRSRDGALVLESRPVLRQ